MVEIKSTNELTLAMCFSSEATRDSETYGKVVNDGFAPRNYLLSTYILREHFQESFLKLPVLLMWIVFKNYSLV